MNLRNKFVGLSNRLKLSIKMFFILAALSYFIFHTINGNNGARSYFIIKKQIATQQKKLDFLTEKEKKLEKEVRLLGNKVIDLDLLEERCRIVLGYAFPNDIIFNGSTIYED